LELLNFFKNLLFRQCSKTFQDNSATSCENNVKTFPNMLLRNLRNWVMIYIKGKPVNHAENGKYFVFISCAVTFTKL